ncbi:hypothetical protein ACVW0Y_003733 [Pseudomonas sp. TE3786]
MQFDPGKARFSVAKRTCQYQAASTPIVGTENNFDYSVLFSSDSQIGLKRAQLWQS